MGAVALGCGRLRRRAALAINLALHPDEPDGGVGTGQQAVLAINLALHPDEPDGGVRSG